MRRTRAEVWLAGVCLLFGLLRAECLAAETLSSQAALWLERIGCQKGVCVCLGQHDARLACALAEKTSLRVLLQAASEADFHKMSQEAEAAGLLGRQVFVSLGPAEGIALTDSLADAVVAPESASDSAAVSVEEMLRVVRPGGKVIIGEKQHIKPTPRGIDEWTHHYHGPDNNPQSRDKLARAPYLTQFVAEPRYAPAPQIAVAAGGRLFAAFGHIAWHQREEPWLNTLVALNAYNGTMLWRRSITPGWMVDRSILVATPEVLYFAEGQSLKFLDAASGRVRDEIRLRGAGEGEDAETWWKWIALDGGVLYALIGPPEKPDKVARWRRTAHGWPWGGISEGYNAPDYRFGFGRTLVALDPESKRVLWRHTEQEPIDSRSLCLRDKRIYFCRFGRYLACLDATSGRQLWRRTVQQDPELFEAIGPYRPGHGYISGWKSTVYLKCTDKALYFVGPQVSWLTALAASDGDLLFRHRVINLQAIVRPDGLYTIGPQKSTGQTQKLDPLSGEVLSTFDTCRRACTRATGTVDGILFRAHGGSGRLDTATGRMQWISPMRPSCQVGVIVAHGHLYWIPWVCDCNLQLFGVICCGPAGDFAFEQQADEAEHLQVFASPSEAKPFVPQKADWPTWRADNQRTARSSVRLPAEPKLLWQFTPHAPFEPTGPVMAGNLVFLAGQDGVVRAWEAQTGKLRWQAYTGGPVWYPPAIARHRAFVGSADGWVYAFEAATGRLLWRFRAAPEERRINFYDKLISIWPVASGVLATNEAVYFAAGITDYDGTHVYALEPASGRILWQNHHSGHLERFSRRGVACQGELLLHEDKLYLAGGNAVSPGVFDAKTGKCLNQPPTGMGTFARRGRELVLRNGKVLPVGQPLHSRPEAPVFDTTVQWDQPVVRAADGDLLCLRRQTDSGPIWQLVAQRPDSDQPLWTRPLPEAPIRWAVAIDAAQRIAVVLRSGRVLCFGPAAQAGPGG